jgi:hypothetical protein
MEINFHQRNKARKVNYQGVKEQGVAQPWKRRRGRR